MIATCADAFGTASTYACTGPLISSTVSGGAVGSHELMNSAELPMSGNTPPEGGSHGSVALAGVQPAFSPVDGTYCMAVVIAAVWWRKLSMFVHDPEVENTSVIGLAVLSRSARPNRFSRFSCVSPAWT